MDEKRLEEIRTRCKNAIPGELTQVLQLGDMTGNILLAERYGTGQGIGVVWTDHCPRPEKAQAMADLWANAQPDIQSLLEEIDGLRGLLRDVDKQLEAVFGAY